MFLNTRGARFANISAVSGVDFPDDARAVACVDWDFDGDLDLWISNRNAPQLRFLRNDVENQHGFVALQLRGSHSNRDAIGARVEVVLQDARVPALIRTLTAGDGYLTQSSKWLHFGLGSASRIKEIRVRWPAGNVERFDGLQLNRRYLLIEGTGHATLREPPRRPVKFQPSTTKTPFPSQQSAAYSLVRLPVPRLQFEDMNGQKKDVIDLQGHPVLILLWASWCQPCLRELQEVIDWRRHIEGKGLRVLALNVDGPNEGLNSDPDTAQWFPAQIGFPFDAGIATTELLEKLQLLNDHLFGLQKRLPLPASFLIDRDRRLAAIYRGRVDIQRLLEDVDALTAGIEERRSRSVPFNGLWARTPRTLPLAPFVFDLMKAGYLEDASEYVQRYQGFFGGEATLLDLVVRLGMEYLQQGQQECAELHFRMARKIEPRTVGPELSRGRALEAEGKFGAATKFYREAVRRNRTSPQALNNLAWIMATSPDASVRDGAEVLRLATIAVNLTGRSNPELLDTLAAALAEQERYDDAVTTLQQALANAKSHGLFRLVSEIEARQRLYQQGRPYRIDESAAGGRQ